MTKPRAVLLALGVAFYAVAAWSVAPGFYDGFTPVPYHWVNPPPRFAHGNTPPAPGHASVRVATNGESDPTTVSTDDNLQPQCLFSVVPGAFAPTPNRAPIAVDIKPVASFPPPPPGIRLLTNVYLVTASQPLVKDAVITLTFSDGQPAPTAVHTVQEGGGSWRSIGSTGAASPFSISAQTRTLGYFAAGYDVSRGSAGPRVGGGQLLPIVTAAAIVIVVLAGVPLALLRRRRQAAAEDEEPEPE